MASARVCLSVCLVGCAQFMNHVLRWRGRIVNVSPCIRQRAKHPSIESSFSFRSRASPVSRRCIAKVSIVSFMSLITVFAVVFFVGRRGRYNEYGRSTLDLACSAVFLSLLVFLVGSVGPVSPTHMTSVQGIGPRTDSLPASAAIFNFALVIYTRGSIISRRARSRVPLQGNSSWALQRKRAPTEKLTIQSTSSACP